MSRCIREREIFSLLEGSLKPMAENRTREHLAGCSACSARVEAVERLRAAALEALPPLEPAWNKIDPAIEHAITQATRRPTPRIVWAPFALSAAAAALVAIALLVSRPMSEPLPRSSAQSEFAVAPLQAPRPNSLESLDCRVIESSINNNLCPIGQSLVAGDEVNTPADSDVRIGMGPLVAVNVFPSSKMELHSAAVSGPAIELVKGSILIDVPAAALEWEMMVLAGDTVFTILDGVFEISVTENGTMIAVLDGEIMVEDRDEPIALTAGIWRPVQSTGDHRQDWLKLELTELGRTAHSASSQDQTEREPYRPTGTLPKRVIRETFDRIKPTLKACYEMSLKRFPELEASVTARVSVGLRGQVSRVRLRGSDRWPELKRCVGSALGQMSFPPPSGGTVELIFPLRLAPEN